MKSEMISLAGGRCQICGYDRCDKALEFHHEDPSVKSMGVSELLIANARASEIEAEVSKCVLLCANCHREVEEGLTELPASTGLKLLS